MGRGRLSFAGQHRVGALVCAIAAGWLLGAAPAGASPQFSTSTIGVGHAPVAVASADLNGDGRPDVVVANRDDDSISVLLGTASGSLAAPVAYPVGAQPVAVAIGYLDAGTTPDIAVADSGDDTAATLIGNGDGTFAAAQTLSLPTGADPQTVSIGDLPDPVAGATDHIGDLALATPGTSDVTLVFRDAAGSEQSTFSVAPPGATPIAAAVSVESAGGQIKTGLVIANAGTDDVDYVPATPVMDCDTFTTAVVYPVTPTLGDSCSTPTLFGSIATDASGAPLAPTGLARLDDALVPPRPKEPPRFAVLRGGSDQVSLLTVDSAYGYGVPPRLTVTNTITLPGAPRAAAAGHFDADHDIAVSYAGSPSLSLLASRATATGDRLDVDGPAADMPLAAPDLDGNGYADLVAPIAGSDALAVLADRWPTATTGDAAAVGPSGATLAGVGDGRGLAGSYRFSVRSTDTPFSVITAPQPLPADGRVSLPVSGLPAGQSFSYRLSVTTGVGTVYGAERTFATAGDGFVVPTHGPPDDLSAPYGCAGCSASPPAAPSNHFSVTHAVSGATATLRTTLPGPGTLTASGRYLTKRTAHAKAKGPARLTVSLTAAGRRALARSRRHRLAIAIRVVFTPSGGVPRTVHATLTFTTKRGRR